MEVWVPVPPDTDPIWQCGAEIVALLHEYLNNAEVCIAAALSDMGSQ